MKYNSVKYIGILLIFKENSNIVINNNINHDLSLNLIES